ncbi:MAG: hypothetical protein AAAB35_28965 [Phyllobacterium sp.]|uniref:hypothetical protein n=1 Tax=Phyllobacterium sp. TaxID=1871046 RepID=UPI0030F1F93E
MLKSLVLQACKITERSNSCTSPSRLALTILASATTFAHADEGDDAKATTMVSGHLAALD